jgi:hypothetical protein
MQALPHRHQYDTPVFEREDAAADAIVARVLGNASGRDTAAR